MMPPQTSSNLVNSHHQAADTKRCEGSTVLPQQHFVHSCPYIDAPCPWVEVYRGKCDDGGNEYGDSELEIIAGQLPCHNCGVATEAQA